MDFDIEYTRAVEKAFFKSHGTNIENVVHDAITSHRKGVPTLQYFIRTPLKIQISSQYFVAQKNISLNINGMPRLHFLFRP